MSSFLSALAQKPEEVILAAVCLGFFVLFISKSTPTMQTLVTAANLLNSKGGNLLVLSLLSVWFFAIGVRFAYHLIELTVYHALTPDNAIALSTFSFITGTAFGGAFGALLKGMSGETVTPPSTTTTHQETTTSTQPAKIAAPVEPVKGE